MCCVQILRQHANDSAANFSLQIVKMSSFASKLNDRTFGDRSISSLQKLVRCAHFAWVRLDLCCWNWEMDSGQGWLRFCGFSLLSIRLSHFYLTPNDRLAERRDAGIHLLIIFFFLLSPANRTTDHRWCWKQSRRTKDDNEISARVLLFIYQLAQCCFYYFHCLLSDFMQMGHWNFHV